MLKRLTSNKYSSLVLYFLISLLFLSPALVRSGLPFKYDWSWPLFDLKWFSSHFFDFSNISIITVFTKYTDLSFALFGLIVRNPSIGLKIYLLLVTTLAAWGFHLLIKDKIQSRILALLAPIIYAFTPYLFIRIIVGFQTSQVAYAALPFFYYFYFKRQKINIRNLLFSALALSFVFAQSQAGALVSLTIFFSLLVSVFYRSFIIEIKKVLILVSWFLLLNLPWLIALFTHKSNISINSGNDVTTLNYIANLPHSLRNVLMLSDHLVTRDFFYALARDNWMTFGFGLIFLVVLISILNKRRRRYVLIFGFTALVILPFTVGPTGKFTEIFSWTFNHFPQLALFRETYHFEFFLAFVLVFLFVIGADYLVSKIKINQQVSAIILVSLGLFIIAPFLTFDFAGYLNLQKVPSDYGELANYLKDTSSCSKIYYPPSLGFVYFNNDRSRDAANSDLLAAFTGVPYETEASSVLNLADNEMFERNLLTSLYLDKNDSGQFASEFQKSGLDCLVVRTDLDTKYDQVSNLWREKDSSIRAKWFQSDMLALARSKQGLEEVKHFDNNIYIFKINPKFQIPRPKADQPLAETMQQFNNLTIARLPITDWANNYDYYKDGWSRGRYAFWRKELFAVLKQDFIYTDKPGSALTGKIAETGKYELWVRYLTGGTPGNFQILFEESATRTKEDSSHLRSNDNFQTLITKDTGAERFVWKDLGEVDINNSQVEIKNISGENAIADLVLVSK